MVGPPSTTPTVATRTNALRMDPPSDAPTATAAQRYGGPEPAAFVEHSPRHLCALSTPRSIHGGGRNGMGRSHTQQPESSRDARRASHLGQLAHATHHARHTWDDLRIVIPDCTIVVGGP